MLAVRLATLLSALVAVHAVPLRAQALPAPLEEYDVRVLGAEQNLPRWIRAVARTPDGFLYVPTGRGLARFDGHAFGYVPLPDFGSLFLRQIHVDPAGRVWIRSIEGDIGYVRGRSVRVLTPDIEHLANHYTFTSTADGATWIGGTAGVLRVGQASEAEPERFGSEDGLPSGSVVGVFTVPGAGDVAVTRRRLAQVMPGGGRSGWRRFEAFGPAYELPAVYPGLVHVDDSGLWLAAEDGLLRLRDGRLAPHSPPGVREALEISDFDWRSGRNYLLRLPFARHLRIPNVMLPGGESADHATLALHARGGDVWLAVTTGNEPGTRNHLVRVRDGRFEPLPLREHHAFDRIHHLHEDHEGSLWVSTDQGLLQLVPRRVLALTRRHGLRHPVTGPVLQTRDGALWVGTWGGGLHRFADGRLSGVYMRESGLPSSRVRALYEASDGTLWVGTESGYAAIRDGRLVEREHEAPDRSVLGASNGEIRAFAQTPDGTLWMAENDRLRRRTPHGWVDHRHDVLSGRDFWTMHAAADGAVWVGGARGLFRVDGSDVREFGTVDGLRSPFVVSIHEQADGTLWFGTYQHGLHRWRGGRFVAVTTQHGLPSGGAWRMLEDGRGGVWVSTDNGVFRVDVERLNAVADAVERGEKSPGPLTPVVFREAEGMPSRESNRASPGGWRLADGRLVFNNQQGLVVIEPERALEGVPPPRTVVRRAVADGRDLPLYASSPPRLPAGSRHIAFEFTALAYTAPSQTRYRYHLDGYDVDWIYAGAERRASYTNLRPGRYTFRAQAAVGSGEWSEAVGSYAFVLPPLPWQRRSLQVTAAASLLALLGLAYRSRVRHLLQVERLRLRIAADLHDDVGSNLSSIALLSEMLRERVPADRLERRQLERIHNAAEETIVRLRDVIWLVDPKHGNLAQLVRKMTAAAADLLAGVRYTIDAPDPDPRPLDMPFMRNVLLIYKEGLHNAVRHASARRVDVRISAKNGVLRVCIDDDGRGLSGRPGDGRGMASMRRRAEEIGARLTLESGRGGTRLELEARMA